MKKTGITRRIDNLGRIVIPKEIRKNLKIKNGETLEIFVSENDNIILKRYNELDTINNINKEIGQSLYNMIKKDIIITNNHQIIYTNKKEKLNKEISSEIIDLIQKRKETTTNNIFVNPIILNGDILGSIILEDKNITEIEKKLIKLSANFLSKHIEA